MTFHLSASNLFKFLSMMTPLLLVIFLGMNSLINQDLKVFIYLMGILMASGITILIMNLIKSPREADASPFCDILSLPFFNVITQIHLKNSKIQMKFSKSKLLPKAKIL